jgi:hypothetical protein
MEKMASTMKQMLDCACHYEDSQETCLDKAMSSYKKEKVARCGEPLSWRMGVDSGYALSAWYLSLSFKSE